MSLFHKEYRHLSDSERELIHKLKTEAEKLLSTITHAPANRERSIAITNLEQAIMWAVKGITG